MADGPAVSVAMATYNGEKYIREQLESLTTQLHLPAELVVTDDGSSDQTIDVVEAFARRANFPVKLVRNEDRLGFANNFLKAASLCSGDLIAFSDQDDVWMREKIKVCAEAFDSPEVILAIHSSRIWFGGDQFGPVHHPFVKKSRLPPISVDPFDTKPGYSMVIRRKLLHLSQFEERPKSSWGDEQMSHDEWCWFLAAFFGDIVQIPNLLAWYRQHGENVAGARKKKSLWRIIANSALSAPYSQGATNLRQAIEVIAHASGPGVTMDRKRAALDFLGKRSALFERRGVIYKRKSVLKDRLSGFFWLLRSGGYFGAGPSSPWSRNAMAKDLFFGIPGFYKLRRDELNLIKTRNDGCEPW